MTYRTEVIALFRKQLAELAMTASDAEVQLHGFDGTGAEEMRAILRAVGEANQRMRRVAWTPDGPTIAYGYTA